MDGREGTQREAPTRALLQGGLALVLKQHFSLPVNVTLSVAPRSVGHRVRPEDYGPTGPGTILEVRPGAHLPVGLRDNGPGAQRSSVFLSDSHLPRLAPSKTRVTGMVRDDGSNPVGRRGSAG